MTPRHPTWSSTNPSAALSALLLDLANWHEHLRAEAPVEQPERIKAWLARGGRS